MKVLIAEPESGALREFLSSRPERRVSSAILRTEALHAVRHLGSDALATVRDGLRNVDLVAIDDRILDAAGVLEPRILRTLDAIHVATVLSMGDDLTEIVTYDDRMAEAAHLLGLRTTSPADCLWCVDRLILLWIAIVDVARAFGLAGDHGAPGGGRPLDDHPRHVRAPRPDATGSGSTWAGSCPGGSSARSLSRRPSLAADGVTGRPTRSLDHGHPEVTPSRGRQTLGS